MRFWVFFGIFLDTFGIVRFFKVTIGYYWKLSGYYWTQKWRKVSKNSIKSPFCPLQELEVSLRSGLYLLIYIKPWKYGRAELIMVIVFHWIGLLSWFSHIVDMSIHMCVCLWNFKTSSSRGCWDIWLKGVSLILAYDDTIYFLLFYVSVIFLCSLTSLEFWSQPSVSQPTVDNGGVSRGWVPFPHIKKI